MNLELKGLTDIYYVIKETAFEVTEFLMPHEKLHFQGWRLLSANNPSTIGFIIL